MRLRFVTAVVALLVAVIGTISSSATATVIPLPPGFGAPGDIATVDDDLSRQLVEVDQQLDTLDERVVEVTALIEGFDDERRQLETAIDTQHHELSQIDADIVDAVDSHERSRTLLVRTAAGEFVNRNRPAAVSTTGSHPVDATAISQLQRLHADHGLRVSELEDRQRQAQSRIGTLEVDLASTRRQIDYHREVLRRLREDRAVVQLVRRGLREQLREHLANHDVTFSPNLDDPDIPLVAVHAYQLAARWAGDVMGCSISWSTIGAIGRHESNHGRFQGTRLRIDGSGTRRIIGIALDGTRSLAVPDTDRGLLDGDPVWDRALGPMQFIPSTWLAYVAMFNLDVRGIGRADVHNMYDASRATAALLCRTGQDLTDPDDGVRTALWAYNPSHRYVDAVSQTAMSYAALTVPDLVAGDTPWLPVADPVDTRARGRNRVPASVAGWSNGRLPNEVLVALDQPGHRLAPEAAAAYQTMKAAAAVDGLELRITDSYRSFDQQVDLVHRKGLYRDGGWAAVPGTSDHGWGLAVDVDVTDPVTLAWMRDHGPRFGFIEDTPREPWHWAWYPLPASDAAGDSDGPQDDMSLSADDTSLPADTLPSDEGSAADDGAAQQDGLSPAEGSVAGDGPEDFGSGVDETANLVAATDEQDSGSPPNPSTPTGLDSAVGTVP